MTARTDSLFKTNLKQLALSALPTWLRKPLCGALLFAGITPLSRLLNDLRKFREETNYRLQHNGQVCKLRGLLNDEFDRFARRITIEDSDSAQFIEASTLWKRETERWIMLPVRDSGTALIHREGFSGISGYDFWINVPAEIMDDQVEARMRALANNYKLASKRYSIYYRY